MEIWGGNQLVDTSVTMPGLDAWVYSKPYGQSSAGGGDVHYVSSCATGRVTRLLVADVSGHGAQVCSVAGTLRTLMRKYVNYIDQAEFVRSMNRQFVALSAADCFATAIVTTFYAPTNSLSLCNAGHPAPLLYRSATRRWDLLDLENRDRSEDTELANIPLGVEDIVQYEKIDVTLDPGDLVLCYTDSLIESRATAAPDGDLLGTEGVLDIIRTLDARQPAALIPALLAAIAAKAPGNLENDDVTVLLFTPSALHRRTPFRDRFMAPFRVARGIAASLKPGGDPAPIPELTIANIGGAMFDALSRFGQRGEKDQRR
jgi:serine phosphatase RsbU (regulator of sigma subunit)